MHPYNSKYHTLLFSKFVANKVKDSHCRHGFNCKLETVFNDL
jgi:hypothetical protein